MVIRSSDKQVNECIQCSFAGWLRACLFFAVIVYSCLCSSGVLANEVLQLNGAPVLGNTSEETSLLKPIVATETWFDRVTFAGGVAYETLSARTRTRFTVPNLGVFGAYSERIRGPWAGGMNFWLSSWHLRGDNDAYYKSFEFPFLTAAPVRIFTHVEWVPHFDPSSTFFDWKGFRYFRPSVFAGVGYITFLEQRGWPLARRKGLGGEAAVRYGFGTRFILPQTVSLQLFFEMWRGVKTFDYTGQALTVAVELGDVDKR